MCRIAAVRYLSETSQPSPPPPIPTEGVNVALRPHPISYQTPPPFFEGLNFALWPTFAGKLPSKSGCRCRLLAGNLFISLAGSEEQMNFSQQSPKMFKIASDIFIHAFLLFLGLFLKIFRLVPLLVVQYLRCVRLGNLDLDFEIRISDLQ